jgi:hypothetical protein
LKSASNSAWGQSSQTPDCAPSVKGTAQTSLCIDILQEILVCMVHQVLHYSGEVNRSVYQLATFHIALCSLVLASVVNYNQNR